MKTCREGSHGLCVICCRRFAEIARRCCVSSIGHGCLCCGLSFGASHFLSPWICFLCGFYSWRWLDLETVCTPRSHSRPLCSLQLSRKSDRHQGQCRHCNAAAVETAAKSWIVAQQPDLDTLFLGHVGGWFDIVRDSHWAYCFHCCLIQPNWKSLYPDEMCQGQRLWSAAAPMPSLEHERFDFWPAGMHCCHIACFYFKAIIPTTHLCQHLQLYALQCLDYRLLNEVIGLVDGRDHLPSVLRRASGLPATSWATRDWASSSAAAGASVLVMLTHCVLANRCYYYCVADSVPPGCSVCMVRIAIARRSIILFAEKTPPCASFPRESLAWFVLHGRWS